MNILYIANHGQIETSADDEGAIEYALTQLGHKVWCVQEYEAAVAVRKIGSAPTKPDLVLFHKWHSPLLLRQIEYPKVFWYFDLVDYHDPTLRRRCDARIGWMRDILPLVDIGFCTDGDWAGLGASVRSDQIGLNADKLVWLTQGFDERGYSTPRPDQPSTDILFTGIRAGGQVRSSFVEEMESRYSGDDSPRFTIIQRGIYGPALAREIAYSRIVVAPDGPISDYYWSNRVYNVLGYGGFLLHPYCGGLEEFYTNYAHLVYYENRAHLHELIRTAQDHYTQYKRIAEEGKNQTLAAHTYRHRCETLLSVVRERLGVG